MRTASRFYALIVLIEMISGCSDIVPKGSGSAAIEMELEQYQQREINGTFILAYSTWLEFDRDLTVPIDNLFAQVKAGNSAFTNEAERYFKVGLDVLQQQHGLVFPPPTVSADPKTRALRLGPVKSDWVYDKNSSSFIPRIAAWSIEKVRWRGTVLGAVLLFNQLQPKKVDVYAKLKIDIEHKTDYGLWEPAKLEKRTIVELEQDLASKITSAYGNYLQARFGVSTSSPRFRGIHPIDSSSDTDEGNGK